jgi:hypothetical protein
MLSDDEAMFRDRALADLRHHWSGAYEITEALGAWRAVRLDNQRALVAADPGELRDLIRADYAANPVPRQRLRGRPQLDLTGVPEAQRLAQVLVRRPFRCRVLQLSDPAISERPGLSACLEY